MTQTIRVLVADDHAVVRAGVRDLLDDESDITVVGEARNGQEALEFALAQRPDVVLMDVSMPLLCGLEATRRIRSAAPEVRVLALTAHEESPYVEALLGAGAIGYLLKTVAGLDLRRAVRAAATGHAVLDPIVATQLLVGERALGVRLEEAVLGGAEGIKLAHRALLRIWRRRPPGRVRKTAIGRGDG